MSDVTLAHIINPMGLPACDAFFPIQEITFQSILNARAFSENLSIELLTTQFEEDRVIVPNGFTVLQNLTKSVRDVLGNDRLRKLPFIDDILKTALQETKAAYIVFTNMDIGLMPYFYDFVVHQIHENNFDAMLITRRRLGHQYKSKNQLAEIYADKGKPHPGYDTFVMERAVAERLVLDKICVGVPFLEVSLLHNLVAFAKKIKVFDQEHLTFHIGMEVMPPVNPSLYQYNRGIYENRILPEIKPLLTLSNFPYADKSFVSRIFKWGLNPCYRTSLMLEMEQMNFRRKIKFLIDELRWRLLQSD
jgi:hypothetical protein